MTTMVITTSSHAYASTCAVKETTLTTPQFYRVSDSVFVGTISSINNYTYNQWKIQFNAEKVWKGENHTAITLMANSLQACGYSLVDGDKYLVFANGSPLSLNPMLTKPYAEAQDAITLYNNPQFQSEEMDKEAMIKKLETAKDDISNMMGSRITFGIPFNMVGVDVLNATLDVGIDSTKATLSKSEYEKKIKDLVGDLPMDVEFMQITPVVGGTRDIPTQNASSATPGYAKHPQVQQIPQLDLDKLPPVQQYAHGIAAKNVICNGGLQLVVKAEDGSPACLDQTTIPKLIARNWLSTNPLDQNNTFAGDFYPGIENDSGTTSIKNQTYYIMTIADKLDTGKIVQFHGVTFSFPYGWFFTPGGGLLPVAITFPDGITETYGYTKKNPEATAFSGLYLGPGPSSNRTITILGNHMRPQAGVTLTEDKIKLLVSTDANPPNVPAETSDPSDALKLNLSTSSQVIQPGQPIGITISVNNTLSKQITLSDENSWKLDNLSVNPCTSAPYGIAIFDGFYTAHNMTEGRALSIFNDDALCPFYNKTTQGYVFEPSSGHVTLNNCAATQSDCSSGFDMGVKLSLGGVWKYGQIQSFSPGLYTIVGGDEWGHVSIEHFVVSNSTVFAGNLGSMSCPMGYSGIQFGATIKNSTGFANYYNSTQYGNTFFLHPGMKGTITVRYDSPANAAWFQNNGNAPLNMTNSVALFYMANVTEGRSTISYAASLSNDKTGHHSQICHYGIQFGGGFEEPCDTDNRGDIPSNELPFASKLLHVGINTSFEPDSVMLYPDSNPVFTVTVSANSNATKGVYWLSLGRDLCGPAVLAKLVVLP